MKVEVVKRERELLGVLWDSWDLVAVVVWSAHPVCPPRLPSP